jgi:hypothetical protein
LCLRTGISLFLLSVQGLWDFGSGLALDAAHLTYTTSRLPA